MRHSFEAERNDALHSNTVWLCEQGMVFCQAKSVGKKNEIQSVQALIGTLELAGATVTLDAMHCQKKTAKLIRKHWMSSIERMMADLQW